MTHQKLWSKEFLTLSTINFLLTVSLLLLMVTMSSFTIETYHISISTTGFIASVFVIGSLIGRLLLAKFTQALREYKLLAASLIISSVVSFGYFYENIVSLIIIRLLHGFIMGVLTTLIGTICVKVIPNARKGEGIGYFSLSGVLGGAIGPLIGVSILNANIHLNWIFIFNLIIHFINIFIIIFVKVNIKTTTDKNISKQKFHISQYIDKQTIPISIFALILSFAYSSVTTYLTIYGKLIHLIELWGTSF